LMSFRVRRRSRFVYLDETGVDGEGRPRELPGRGPDPEGQVAAQQLNDVLSAEVRRIPPLFREVLRLHDIEDLPMSDVAARLGITVAAAKSRLLRARTELRWRVTRRAGATSNVPMCSRSAASFDRVVCQRAATPVVIGRCPSAAGLV
jgi:RNA polymerase sigma-70 factor (ECF subfamily)